jgi:hypothetical protein
MADLSQIQNRSGNRKAAVEMAFGDQAGGRAEAKELFRHLRRIRAAKEPVEHARTVDLCRQAAETLTPAGRGVDLQEHTIRNAREAARRAQEHQQHHEPLPSPKTRPGAKPGLRDGPVSESTKAPGSRGAAPSCNLYRYHSITAGSVSLNGAARYGFRQQKAKTATVADSGFGINPPG